MEAVSASAPGFALAAMGGGGAYGQAVGNDDMIQDDIDEYEAHMDGASEHLFGSYTVNFRAKPFVASDFGAFGAFGAMSHGDEKVKDLPIDFFNSTPRLLAYLSARACPVMCS